MKFTIRRKVWTPADQRALEEAIQRHPATLSKRLHEVSVAPVPSRV